MSFEHQLTLLCVDSRVGCIQRNVAAFKSRIKISFSEYSQGIILPSKNAAAPAASNSKNKEVSALDAVALR